MKGVPTGDGDANVQITDARFLPIVSADAARIGLVEEIDRMLPCDMEVSPGTIVLAMILDALTGKGSIIQALPELGTLTRKKIASLVGIAPMNRDSGQMRGKRMITGGRPSVRNMLYMATVASLRSNPKMAPFYRRLREAGKPAKVAMVAAMRKLLVMLKAILKSKTAFMEAMT